MSKGYAERFEKALAEHMAAKKKLHEMMRAAWNDADYVEAYEKASDEELTLAATLGRVVSAELSKLAEEKPYDGDLLMRKYLNTGLEDLISFEDYKENVERQQYGAITYHVERRCCE